jgi:hypothetical protein
MYTRETVEREKPSSVEVLDTKNILPPIHPLNGTNTHTIHISIVPRLKNPSLSSLLPFIYTD